MVEIFPAAAVFVPVAVIATIRRRWVLSFLLVSVPLFDVTVFTAVSHPFTVPELSVFSTLGYFLWSWRKGGTVSVADRLPVLAGSGFLATSALSVALVAVRPSTMPVNPYGHTPDHFALEAVSVSFHNVTQLSLRAFFVLAVLAIGLLVDRDDLAFAVRTVVLGAIFAGTVGVLYQGFGLVQSDFLIDLLHWFGDTGRPEGMGSLGPLPRMGSVSGEPGHTAQYLLYAFAVAATLWLGRSGSVFSRRTLGTVSVVLLGLLILTTSGTAYGGLVIFTAVVAVGILASEGMDTGRLLGSLGLSVVFLCGVGLVIASLDVVPIIDLAQRQLRKLSFGAGSGTVRSRYFSLTVDVLRHRPILGLGTGSYYSTSLIGTIAGETGLLGLAAFLAFCLGCVRPALARTTRSRRDLPLYAALSVGLTTLVLTSLVAKSVTTLLSPWFWVALGLPVSLVLATGHRKAGVAE